MANWQANRLAKLVRQKNQAGWKKPVCLENCLLKYQPRIACCSPKDVQTWCYGSESHRLTKNHTDQIKTLYFTNILTSPLLYLQILVKPLYFHGHLSKNTNRTWTFFLLVHVYYPRNEKQLNNYWNNCPTHHRDTGLVLDLSRGLGGMETWHEWKKNGD